MAKRHPIPEAEARGTNLDTMILLELEGYQVGEWTPERDGKGKPTQVHVIFEVKNVDTKFICRFKSAGELDRFIAILARHRFGVWPKKE